MLIILFAVANRYTQKRSSIVTNLILKETEPFGVMTIDVFNDEIFVLCFRHLVSNSIVNSLNRNLIGDIVVSALQYRLE